MASIVIIIGGVLVNALAFTGSSYLFYRLSADKLMLKEKDMMQQ